MKSIDNFIYLCLCKILILNAINFILKYIFNINSYFLINIFNFLNKSNKKKTNKKII